VNLRKDHYSFCYCEVRCVVKKTEVYRTNIITVDGLAASTMKGVAKYERFFVMLHLV
jgi:hypothetical protein